MIEAAFGIALLTMIWIGFRRWLQQKQEIGRLMAERTTKYDAQMKRVEERLNAIERMVADGGVQTAQIEVAKNPAAEPALQQGQLRPSPSAALGGKPPLRSTNVESGPKRSKLPS